MGEERDNIRLRQEIILEIPRLMIKEAFLSVPKWKALNGSGGIVRDRTRANRLAPGKPLPIFAVSPTDKPPYDEHLATLGLAADDPLLIIGARNLGNNLRIVAYKRENGILQLFGEDANKGDRVYWCICYTSNSNFEPHKLKFKEGRISEVDENVVKHTLEVEILWALSGQPLLRDGKTDENAIILNTYDLRHFFSIPTGEGRFGARGHQGAIIEELVTILVDTGDAEKVKQKAVELDLHREQDYLHSAIGISKDGNLIVVQLHGSFELVAERLKRVGATHAIELDEGGSVSTHFVYQKDGQSVIGDSRIFASHYFRPRASALLIFKLAYQEGNKPYIPVKEDSTLGL